MRYMTKLTKGQPFGSEWWGRAPRWASFLGELTGGDLELQDYLQRLAGYGCTGSAREHALPFLLGPGGNGKGTFAGALIHALGDYGHAMPEGFLAEQHGERHPSELARLCGVRFAVASETEAGSAWNEARLKTLTGGDRIAAREMRQDFFEFEPSHTLIVLGNNAPTIRSVDDAIRRRIQVVPLTRRVQKPDLELPAKLAAEADGILTWAIAGAVAWIDGGLRPPRCVLDASATYFDSQDDLIEWIEQECTTGPERMGGPTALHGSYRRFMEERNQIPLGRKRFGNELEKRGFRRDKVNEERVHLGIALGAK